MIQQNAIYLPEYGNKAFDNGVRHGIAWHQTGDADLRQPNAQLLVDFIRDNLLEPAAEGYLNDDRLIDNTGFLVGWIIGEFVK